MIIAVYTIISVAVIIIGFAVLIFMPEDDTEPDLTDAEMVWIEKNGSYLEIYKSNIDPFLKSGWTIWGGEEECR